MRPLNIYFKTGLAVLLAGLVFAVQTANEAIAQPDPPESDSAILARHLHEVKVSYAIEEFSDHSFNSHLTDAQLDSILAEQHLSVAETGYVYAPDSSFAIYYIGLISCGAHCNPVWESYIHLKGTPELVQDGGYFSRIDSITRIADHQYLIYESDWARPSGYYRITTRAVSLLHLDSLNMKYIGISEDPEAEATLLNHGTFIISQETTVDSAIFIKYDPKTARLNYQYGRDHKAHHVGDSVEIVKGHFTYENGRFKKKEEFSYSYKAKGK